MADPLSLLSLGLGGAGVVGNLFEGSRARKDAKRAAAEQRKADKEQRGIDAMLNLISVAGGQGVRGFSQQGAQAPAPQIGIGNQLMNLSNLTRGFQQDKQTSQKLAEDKALNEFRKELLKQQAKLTKERAENPESFRSSRSSSPNTLPSDIAKFRIQ